MGRWDDMSDTKKTGIGCCVAAAVLIGVIVFGVSWATLHPLSRGIDLNTASVTFNEDVFENGRHFLGPSHRFVQFPITWQRIEFRPGGDGPALSSATTDGTVRLEATVYFRFDLDSLVPLYRRFGENGYRRVYIDLIQAAIKEVPSDPRYQFELEDFYERRRDVQAAMALAIEEALVPSHGIFMNGVSGDYNDELCPGTTADDLQACVAPRVMGVFLEVDFDENLSQGIINKVVADEQVNTANNNRDAIQIESETGVVFSNAATERAAKLSQATSTALVMTEEARAEALGMELEAQRDAYDLLIRSLNLTSKELLNFIWLQTVQESGGGSSRMVVGVDNPQLLFGAAAP